MSAGASEREATLRCVVRGREIVLQDGDLTPAGLFVPTAQPEPLDRELDLRLCSPVGDAVLHALVVQVIDRARAKRENRRAGFGVLFTELLDDQRAFIGLTLDALARARASLRPQLQEDDRPARKPSRPQLEAKHAPGRDLARERETAELAKQLTAELSALASKPPWSMLGLDSSATPEQAHAAFVALSKRCHPHRYARYDSIELTRLSTELFVAYKRAASAVGKRAPRPEAAQPIVPSGQSMRPPATRSVVIAPSSKGSRSGTGSR